MYSVIFSGSDLARFLTVTVLSLMVFSRALSPCICLDMVPWDTVFSGLTNGVAGVFVCIMAIAFEMVLFSSNS